MEQKVGFVSVRRLENRPPRVSKQTELRAEKCKQTSASSSSTIHRPISSFISLSFSSSSFAFSHSRRAEKRSGEKNVRADSANIDIVSPHWDSTRASETNQDQPESNKRANQQQQLRQTASVSSRFAARLMPNMFSIICFVCPLSARLGSKR